jgi:hypothetical protein
VKTLANDRDRAAILNRLDALRPDSVRQWGRMTPHQAICHLSDSFRVPLGLRETQPVDASPLKRRLIKWAALYLPLPWPKGVPTRPENDQFIGGSAPVTFDGDRRDLARLINEFSRPGDALASAFHPIFGRIQVSQWQRWGYLHADHHLRQFGV